MNITLLYLFKMIIVVAVAAAMMKAMMLTLDFSAPAYPWRKQDLPM